MKREIAYSSRLAKKFDPLHPNTLAIEAKVSTLSVTAEGKIQGVVPVGSNRALPTNSAFKRVENYNLIIAPEAAGVICLVGEKG